MSLSKRHTFGIMLAAAALIATASLASADEVYKGAVVLPFETHWGGAVLQPGRYTISIRSNFAGSPMIHIMGQGGEQEVLAGSSDLEQPTARGSLTLVNRDGTYVVKRFNAGVIGKYYDFPVPKAKHAEIGRAGRAPETLVSVAGNR